MVMVIRKTKNLYLYLALICFACIVAIFVVDGYFGVYDIVYVTSQEHEQKIEPDYWQQPWLKEQGYGVGTSWGEPVYFKYKIDNRTFSIHEAEVEASIWKSGEKIKQLLDESVSVAPFKDATVEWKLQPEDLGEADLGLGGYREYTVHIRFGDIERKIILSYYREVSGYPEKGVPQSVPVPSR